MSTRQLLTRAVWNPAVRRWLSPRLRALRLPWAPPPAQVWCHLTYRCNLRCTMCNQWGAAGVYRDQDSEQSRLLLAEQDFERLVAELRGTGAQIMLFGGEPMLHPAWWQLARCANDNGILCNITTNGTLIGEQLEQVLAAGLHILTVSIDGAEQGNDQVRGSGVYRRIMDGLRALEQHRDTAPPVNVCTVMTDLNQGSLVALAEQLQELSIVRHIFYSHSVWASAAQHQQHLQLLRETVDGVPDHWQGFSYGSPAIDIEGLVNEVTSLRALPTRKDFRISFAPNLSSDEIRRYYGDPGFRMPAHHRCTAPWREAEIYPNGDLSPCLNMGLAVANINRDGLLKSWNCKSFRKLRRLVKAHHRLPGCQRCLG